MRKIFEHSCRFDLCLAKLSHECKKLHRVRPIGFDCILSYVVVEFKELQEGWKQSLINLYGSREPISLAKGNIACTREVKPKRISWQKRFHTKPRFFLVIY